VLRVAQAGSKIYTVESPSPYNYYIGYYDIEQGGNYTYLLNRTDLDSELLALFDVHRTGEFLLLTFENSVSRVLTYQVFSVSSGTLGNNITNVESAIFHPKKTALYVIEGPERDTSYQYSIYSIDADSGNLT